MASSSRVTPKPVTSPVSMGWSQETGTKDWAPRLYTSCGRAVCSAETSDFWSNRSPEISSILSCKWPIRSKLTVLLRRTSPKTS